LTGLRLRSAHPAAVCDGLLARLWRRVRLTGDSGVTTIETAISLIFVFNLAFWLFEMSLFVQTYAVLDDATHEGVRYAISHGSDSSNCSGPTTGCADLSGANVQATVSRVAALSFHDPSAMTVTVAYPDATGSAPGSLVTVTLSYPYVPLFSGLGFSPTIKVTAQGRIVY
jgi:Flp pilus assembly protein TadG